MKNVCIKSNIQKYPEDIRVVLEFVALVINNKSTSEKKLSNTS